MSIVIREPVWGDLHFDDLEAAIIQTRQMQRLRWIKQLGTAYVAYPGATHTRFEHSLGTCHMAGKVFDAVLRNATDHSIVSPEDRRDVRLLGLLHDVAHVPFGHILEDELELFGANTHDRLDRLNVFLAPIATEYPHVQEQLTRARKPALLSEIGHVLSSAPEQLEKPYLLEIVKNTVCADLLDYLRRDYYYLGIRRVYDERIYNYFSVANHEGKPHLIVELTEDGLRAEDALTELDHLLRIRYTLAERVFFHETKLAFDAMLDKAVFHSDLRLKRGKIDWLGDEGLLNYLEGVDPDPLVNELGALLKARDHYRPSYLVTAETKGRKKRWQRYMEVESRREVEREIADKAGPAVTYDQIAVFCPDWDMSMKEANVLVRDHDGAIHPLKRHSDSDARRINQQHERLWKFYVYCPEEFKDRVAHACVQIFGCANEYAP